VIDKNIFYYRINFLRKNCIFMCKIDEWRHNLGCNHIWRKRKCNITMLAIIFFKNGYFSKISSGIFGNRKVFGKLSSGFISYAKLFLRLKNRSFFLATCRIEPANLWTGCTALFTTSLQGITDNNSSIYWLVYFNQ
jgi:hypothetical protein